MTVLRGTRFVLVLICAAALAGFGAAARAAQGVNIAGRCRITAEYPLPNALWTPAMAADGQTGPIKGWLGTWGNVDKKPWIQFELPQSTLITGMDVLSASFQETGPNRFARPRVVVVEFFSGKTSETLAFELADSESEFQAMEFEPRTVDKIKLTIDSVYLGGARISDMAGFQEVRIYTPGDPGAETGKNGAESRKSPDTSLDYKGNPAGDPDASGALDTEEREILNLLRTLLDRLEKKFLED